MGNISIMQLLIIAAIVVLLFGTNKLRNLGSDLGSAIKGFKKALSEEDEVKKVDNTHSSASTEDLSITSAISAEKRDKDRS